MTDRLFQDTVRALSLVLDFDEGQKLFHAWRVALLSCRIAGDTRSCPPEEAYYAGLLHDLGGLGLPDHLVHHATRGFTDAGAREHAHRGADILEPFAPFSRCLAHIRDHHERFDGQGFPDRKSGAGIDPVAYILHLADHLEVVLRSCPPEDRLELALAECRRAADSRVPSAVAQAFLDRFGREPRLIDLLYDDEALSGELETLELPVPDEPGKDATETLSQLLWLLARVVDTKHAYTMGHSARVAFWAWRIARELGTARVNLWDIVWAGLLHDIGKIAIPRTLLNKRAPLTTRDWSQMKLHARHSMELISKIRDLEHLAYPAAAHHERYAGGGYPLGNAREDIPLIGRILAFADAYDAMTTDRGYNLSLTHEQALASIASNVGTQFDPRIAPVALRVLGSVPATSTEILQTMGGFADFFRKEEASFLSLVERAGTTTAVISTDLGPALLGTEAWRRLRVDADFRIIEGKDVIVQTLLNFNSDLLLDFLDPHGHSGLRLAAGRLQPGEHAGLLVKAASGLPLELILLRAASGEAHTTVLYRSAEKEVHSARQLAMVYTNFSAGSDAVAFLAPDHVVLDVNHRFETLVRTPRDRLLGRTLATVLDPEALQRIQSGQDFTGELAFLRPDRTRVDTDAALVPLSDAARRPVGFMLRAVDVTARKEDEARLRALSEELARKNRELEGLNRLKSDLMAVTSHDLKSPLSAMISQARFLLDFPDRDRDRVRLGLTRIVDSGEKLLQFIQDLLDLERIDAGAFRFEPEPVRLAPLIREAVETARAQARTLEITLLCEGDSVNLRVSTDARRLLQVLHNLISNAIKFSPADGRIKIRCEQQPGNRVWVSVEDDGPGIPEDQLESIFDRYHQVKGAGTDARGFSGAGLGLFIVKKIVELHAGRVWAELRDEGGSRFVFELPLLAGEPGLQVWLFDPDGSLWPQLETPFALQRVRLTRLQVETQLPLPGGPDAVFLCGSPCWSGAEPDWLDAARRVPTVIVAESDDPAGDCAGILPGAIRWTQPVMDTEVVSFLRGIRLNSPRRQEVS